MYTTYTSHSLDMSSGGSIVYLELTCRILNLTFNKVCPSAASMALASQLIGVVHMSKDGGVLGSVPSAHKDSWISHREENSSDPGNLDPLSTT